MGEAFRVDMFLEDHAHQEFLVPLVKRVGQEAGVDALRVRVLNAQGGHARAVTSYQEYQLLRGTGLDMGRSPELLVVAIDGNCGTFAEKREEIREATSEAFLHALVTACPDPHIERWYVADPQSFEEVVGCRPNVPRKKCDRSVYKKVLADAVVAGGHPRPRFGGIEFAAELVAAMDLFRAGKSDPSFRAFYGDLRASLRLVAGGEGGR